MVSDEVILSRIVALETAMNGHFKTVENDRMLRRENERDFNDSLNELNVTVTNLQSAIETARLSGKFVLAVAVAIGGLVSWIVGLYTQIRR